MKGWRDCTVPILVLCASVVFPVTAEEPGTAAVDKTIDLFSETLPMEIRSSSFGELADWCRRLGLSAQGNRTDIENRLYAHFGISPAERKTVVDSEIKIESAQNTEYFSLDEFGEKYVRLDGGVRITLQDREKGYTYTILGDSILFNQTRKLLSATGNVEYRITGGDRDEVFNGGSLTVDISTWEGYFFEGSSIRERTIDEKSLIFRIQGEFISRSSSDFVIMEDAGITSSARIPANYQIKAEKIWILGPGEWGLRSASLHVGHIPIFYFPFFFYPGDEVLFHPVFGYRSREGTFLQTTTYFLGNRPQEQMPFSFLQLTEDTVNDRRKERQGIFLRDTDRKLSFPERYIKGIFDVYSRLGAFAGIGGDLSGLNSYIKTFTFEAGLGVSRNLYSGIIPRLFTEYTPYWQEADGSLRSFWNTTRLGNTELPFRFGGETTLALVFGRLSMNILLESYSDPYIEEDFYDRQEQIDWSRLIEGVLEEEISTPLKDRLTWRMDSSYSPSTANLSPYITSLSLSRMLVSMDWRSKDIPSAILPSHALTDPTRRFYYPDSFTFPEISLQIGGTILSSSGKPRAAEKAPPETGMVDDSVADVLRPHWEEGAEDVPEEDLTDEFRLPEIRRDIPVTLIPTPVGYNVRYLLRPKLVQQFNTNAREWVEPDDVRYDYSYATMTLQNTAQVLYDLSLYESVLRTQGSLNLATQYQNIDFYDEIFTQTEKDNLSLQAYRYSSLNLSQNLNVSTFPLIKTDIFKSSNLRYAFQSNLYKKSFDSLDGSSPVYKDSWFSVTREMITANRVSMDLIAETLPVTPRFQVSYICPPLDEVFTASAALVTGPLTSTVNFQTKNLENRWITQPVSFDENLRITDQVSLRATYLHDYEEDTPYSFLAGIRLWYFTGSFQAKYTEPYNFEGMETGWVRRDEKRFVPSSASMGLLYEYKPDPFWKNRIQLSSGINTQWTMNLIQFTETSLSFGYSLTLKIHEFLDFRFSTLSKNNMTYRYIPGYADDVDRPWRNPFTDLLRSFNFLSKDDRYESFFKLSSITLEAIHHLEDWDLTVSYTGKPELLTLADGSRKFTWNSVLGIFIRWVPIPQIKSEFRKDRDGLTY